MGTEITKNLLSEGHSVVVADIRPPRDERATFVEVNLLEKIKEHQELQRPDVVINLAGKLIFGKWNKKFKDLIYSTRVVGTRNIVESFNNQKYKPKYLVNASAVGIYGNFDEEEINEDSGFGNSFLAKVAKEWEQEALNARSQEVKVRIIRNAHILGKSGLLGVLLPYYKNGIGGPLGSGKQWMPWVHIDDVSELYISSARDEFPEVINAVAPETIRNVGFSETLAEVLKRPHIFFIPKIALKFLYGEFADEILISQKVATKYSVYDYKFKSIKIALENIFK